MKAPPGQARPARSNQARPARQALNSARSFCDEIYASTFRNQLVSGIRLTDASRRALIQYRIKLKSAEKFILDNDSLEIITEIHMNEKYLQSNATLAWLPFSPMYIEYDTFAWIRSLHKLGRMKTWDGTFDDVSPRSGVLLYHDGEDESRWIAHEFQQMANGDIYPRLLAYVFDPNGSEFKPVAGSEFWRETTVSKHPVLGKLRVTLANVDGKFPDRKIGLEFASLGVLTKEAKEEIDVPPYLRHKIGVIPDPFWFRLKLAPESYNRNLTGESVETAGYLRWLITVLACINALPRDLKPVQRRTGTYTVGPNILPYFQHREITIKLPRHNREVIAAKALRNAFRNARRPWHKVMGHWRVVERGKMQGRHCIHDPQAHDEAGLAMCSKCEMIVRWIKDHTRGDPNIGIVEHTYRVKSER